MPAPDADIAVEVVYAEPGRALAKTFRLSGSSCVADALCLAAADPAFDGVDILHLPVGVFGKAAAPGQALQDGDRVEVYRPLAADPKSARRARARQARP